MTRPRSGDEGAALVVALVFLGVVSIAATALLTMADTSLRTTSGVREQGYELYSASGGVDQAITQVRGNPSLGRDASIPGSSCPSTTAVLNGVTTVVTCEGLAGSGAGGGGGVTNADNSPPNAVLTLAASEVGLAQESNNELRIAGPVVSNSTIDVGVASASLTVDGPVKARNGCTGNGTVTSNPAAQCTLGAAVVPDSSDPGWDMQSGHPAAPVPAPAPQGCPAAGGARLVVFEPGWYSSVAELNDVFARCSGGVFWFKPGFHYFDFTDGASPWVVSGSATRVVGGVRTRWTPAAPAAGDVAPVVPFPLDVAGVTTPGGCVASTEPGATGGLSGGVQFAFGNTSRVRVTDAKVELCAPANTTAQQIALYGVPPARATAATPGTAAYTAAAATAEAAGFANPDAARVPDGASSTFTGTSNATRSLTLNGLATTAAIPAGSTVTDVRLRVVQRPQNGDVQSLQALVTPGDGGAPATVNDAAGSCAASTTAICRTASATAYDQSIGLPASLRSVDAVTGATIELRSRVRNGGVEHVDALQLVVSYTPPSYRALSGCLVQPIESGGCPLLETAGGPTGLSIHGTAYLPTGALVVELTSASNQVLERGVVARSARVKVTGSSTFTGAAISLPPVGGGTTDRVVRFVATQDGVVVLRAVVEFDDSSGPPGLTAEVRSWSVLR